MDSSQNALRTVTWFCFSVEVVAIITRLALKRNGSKPFALDDGLAIAAAASSLASATATSLAVRAGLAQMHGASASENSNVLNVDVYVAEVFHAVCMGTVKLSVLAFVNRVFGPGLPRFLAIICAIATMLWMLSSTLVILFQCAVPEVWDLAGGRCINTRAFWQAFGVVDIVTDAVIVAMPIVVAWNLQTALGKKATIISCFLPWAVTMAVAATSIAYADGFSGAAARGQSPDDRNLYAWFMCAQFLRMTAIMCACVPYVRQFLEAFPSGLMQADEIRRRGLTEYDVDRGYVSQRSADGTVYYLYELGDATGTQKWLRRSFGS